MRRLILPIAAATLALALPAPASAIVNGTEADQGEYPAQGFLQIDTDGAFPDPFPYEKSCGGTLIGSRQFLTSVRCTVDDVGVTLPEGNLLVRLGNVDRSPDPADADDYGVTEIEAAPGGADAAILTLDRPADYQPTRVVGSSDVRPWAPGVLARILGWGSTSTSGQTSEFLLETDVPIAEDARCVTAYGTAYDASTMLCAADPPGTPQAEAHDSCFDDTGGPLLVEDLGELALAGIVSWRGSDCANPAQPGVYTRLGNEPQNGWVHEKTPEADWNFVVDRQPQAGVPFEIQSTSRHPDGAGYFTRFDWDLDRDNAFDDRSGKRITLTIPSPGEAVVGLQASKPGGDKATVYYAFDVQPNPNATPPATPPATSTPPAANPVATGPRATVLVSGRPRVRRGRFAIRIRFARAAPSGTAVIEVYRGRRRIGIARTRVRRGATKRVSVKLTPTGRRLLRRAASKRLKVRVRVRVGRRVLRTKTVTIRR